MNPIFVSLVTAAALATPLASAQPFPAQIDLGELAAGDGFVLNGAVSGDETGYRVAGIGDFNNDGFDDVAISAFGADPNGTFSGSVYVYTGRTALNLSTIDLEDLDGTNGFRIDGLSSNDSLGLGLAGPGDINGDGIDDLLIGAPGGDANGSSAGEIYALFGSPSFPAVLDLTVLDGANGARIDGIDRQDDAGGAVGGAGDFNGDGIDDFLIGADHADPNGTDSGEIYLAFGRTTWPAELELSSLDGSTGFVIHGVGPDDNAGFAVAKAGDVNGDGLGDVLIGAQFADPNGFNSGAAYLVFGRKTSPASVELDDLDGLSGVTFAGVNALDYAGHSVNGLGDINGDGFDDIIIGAYWSDPNGSSSGSAYIVYGKDTWTELVELAELDGTNGVVVNGVAADDELGRAVSGGGDINGDGLDDVVIGAPSANPNGTRSGESYILFGSNTLPAAIELSNINGTNGVTLEGATGADESGWSVASAGDFNGDGLGDIVIGSPEGNGSTGLAHVLFGKYVTGVSLGATGSSCPGPASIRAKGLTPGSELEVYRGVGRGSSTVQAGTCAGIQIDLENAQLLGTVPSNEFGQFLLDLTVPDVSLCGTFLQVVDLATCAESNVTQLPFAANLSAPTRQQEWLSKRPRPSEPRPD